MKKKLPDWEINEINAQIRRMLRSKILFESVQDIIRGNTHVPCATLTKDENSNTGILESDYLRLEA
jgi:hypothetical protein